MAKKNPEPLKGSGLPLSTIAFLMKVRKRIEDGVKAFQHNYEMAREDLKFCNNEGHWDDQIARQRSVDGRPNLVFNLMVPFIRDVIGDQRESRPNTKVYPVGDKATLANAHIKEGYLRNLKFKCGADIAADNGLGQSLRGGFGYIQVRTSYESKDSFNQTIQILPVVNQFAVVFDPAAQQWDCNDGEWMAMYSHMSKDTFERKYPKAHAVNFDATSTMWYPKKDNVTVAEYWEKEHKPEKLFQLSTGEVVKEGDIPEGIVKKVGSEWPNPGGGEPIRILKKRVVDNVKIYRWLVCGHDILEDKVEWPSQYWGIIPVEGDELVIEGKKHLRSLIRFAKDAQRAYNMSRSSEVEVIALAPKAPVKGTPQMFEGFEDIWDNLHRKTYSRAPYNPDPMMPGQSPDRLSGIDPNHIQAIGQSTAQAKEEIRQTIGPNIILPKMPGSHQEISGLALGKWQKEGDTSTFMFVDNLIRAVEQADLVCVDLMSTILDTNRIITIRKIDGNTEEVEINKKTIDPKTQEEITERDMTVGEYGVETSPGPGYATQRLEQAEAMLRFAQAAGPNLTTGTADILASMLFQAQGGQGAGLDEFTHRVKKILLKSGQLDVTDLKEEEIKAFLPILLKPKQMNPLMLSRIRKELGQAAKYAADAQKSMAETGAIQAELQEKMASTMQNLLMIALQQPPQQPGQGGLPAGGGPTGPTGPIPPTGPSPFLPG